MKIRVILGEDSYLASEGIARVLERVDDIELVATHTNMDELTGAVDRDSPDVVLTDVRMPPNNTDEGIRFANNLRSTYPEIGVVVLSQHADPSYAAALFAGGSQGRGYLLKERVASADELARAVREVARGGSVIDPAVVDVLLTSRQQREGSQLDSLTPRELEILGLIAEGRSNAAIASTLVLTKRAVERHINGIFLKLDLGNAADVSRRVRAALLYLAEQEG